MNSVFCSAPWVGLFVDTTGEIKPCCASMYPYGNIHENSIATIINNEKHLEIKQALLSGNKHHHCSLCYKAENATGTSTRQWFNDTFPIKNPQLPEYNLQMIDIRWSNHCNLRCLYCNPKDSSSIADVYGIKSKISVRKWQQQIMDLVRNNILSIKEVYLLGGEPLLIKENLELLDLITDQRISVMTNLSLNYKNNAIFNKLLSKPNVIWEISLEQTGKKFEYIRNGASWKQLVKNIKLLQNNKKQYSFSMLYCLYSAVDLHNILVRLKKLGNVKIELLQNPLYLVVQNHNQKIRDLATHQIALVLNNEELRDWLGIEICNKLQSIQQTVNTSQKNFPISLFDPLLTNEFKNLWPKVYKLVTDK